MYSKVKESKAKTEFVRDFLINEFGNSKVQFVDYKMLKHKLEGACIVERINFRKEAELTSQKELIHKAIY